MKRAAKRGPPVVFDELRRAKAVGLIAGGVSQRMAASYLRIHPSTISKAIQRDAQFRREVRRAQAAARAHPLFRMRRASQKSWRAAVWLIEHGQPETDLTERDRRRTNSRSDV